jgi:hypothetical protein
MITTAELHRLVERKGLRFDQVEKEYLESRFENAAGLEQERMV